ncbi:MAG TPA: hypothetical protein VLI04_15035 [Nocardioidaceae bacterium]|nr:hypothetical protein [Nocardioidaceae bacterium]
MAFSLQELERRLAEARAKLDAIPPSVEPGDRDLEILRLEGEIEGYEIGIRDLVAERNAERLESSRIARGLRNCGVPFALAAVIVPAAVLLGMHFLGDDQDAPDACTATTTLGDVRVQLVAACEPDTTTTPTSPPSGPDASQPDPADLPAGQVLYQGTSGGQLGCIACDGQSRFISIEDSTTGLGDAARAGQEIVWPENGVVVDFGIQIPQPNEGRYGINLFVNGGYSVGCPIETGSSSCRVLAGQEPSPLATGDRVTIIVGEQGIVDENGVPVEEGDFVLEWWFVFQPD